VPLITLVGNARDTRNLNRLCGITITAWSGEQDATRNYNNVDLIIISDYV